MNTRYVRRILCLGWVFLSAGFVPTAKAEFVPPGEVPVERLLKTAEAVAQRNPASPEAHYTLARIHYLAFSRDTVTVPAFSSEQKGNVHLAPSWMIREGWFSARQSHAEELARREFGVDSNPGYRDERFWSAVGRFREQLRKDDWRPPRVTVEERTAHAEKALSEFQKALFWEPTNPLYLLGLASLTDEVLAWRSKEKPHQLPLALEKLTLADAKYGYLRAHELAFKQDSRLKSQPLEGIVGLVSWEAGRGYMRLTESESLSGDRALTTMRQKVGEALGRLGKLPRGAITPMVISLQPVQQLDALLNAQASVEFDLRGYGSRERWPWLQPQAGLLVWDPQSTGRITGASQLFGGYSFQIFRADGYDALAALDGDGDGVLRGDELRGIRVWFDRDGNGISAPDEVCDLNELGIVALATRATAHDGIHPMNSAGVVFADGRTLPSWDWIVEPHGKSHDASH